MIVKLKCRILTAWRHANQKKKKKTTTKHSFYLYAFWLENSKTIEESEVQKVPHGGNNGSFRVGGEKGSFQYLGFVAIFNIVIESKQ